MTNDAVTHASAGTIFKNFVRVLPGAILIAVTLSTGSCDQRGGGIFGTATSSSTNTGTITVTPTSTASPGAAAFVSNYADGSVSSFTRSASNGSLSLVTTIGAGAANGPEGLAVSQANNAVYAVNYSDGNIYEYSIDPTTGAISKQSPASIGNNNGGVASGPEQILINSADSLSGNQFAWVTGTADGSINVYSVDPTTGQLTFNGRGTGFTSPLGMAFQAVGSGGYLYVADSGTGLIHSYSVTPSNGGLAEVAGSPVPSLSSGGGTPALLVFDSTNSRLYVDDNVNGIVTAFGATNGVLGYLTQSAAAPGNSLFGMALTSLSTGEFLYTANQAANTLWSFVVPALNPPMVCAGSSFLSAPTGIVADSTNTYAYVTNQNNGTVSQFTLSGTSCPVYNGYVSTGGNGPYGIVLTH